MKITIRTLTKQEYQFECEPTDTILSLKQQIEQQLKHELAWQTLIYSGQVLTNERSIESCKILEKGFMVLMVKKPKDAPAPVPEKKEAATPVVTPQAQPTTTPTTQAPVTQVQAPAQNQAPQAPTQAAAPAPANEEVVARMMEMGFSRDDCLRALEAAWGNGDRAVELLMMGGPLPQRRPGVPGAGGQDDFQIPDDDISDDEAVGPITWQMLKNTPQFQQLIVVAKTRPEMLEQILQGLPPELQSLITDNQDEFIAMVQEPMNAPQGGAGPQNPAAVPRGPMAAQQGGRGGAPPGGIQILLSPEDQAVVNNLVDMTGCTKDQVLRAYALFEKDAEMTANYLLNHGHDDDPMGPGGFGGGFGGFGQ